MFNFFDGIVNTAKSLWDKLTNLSVSDIFEMMGKVPGKIVNTAIDVMSKHEYGGIIGGNSYTGDKIKIAAVNSGEAVINPSQFNALFGYVNSTSDILRRLGSENGVSYYTTSKNISNILSTIFNSNSNIVSSALNTNNNIKTTPFGENSFRKIPRDVSTENGSRVIELSANDINLNMNGTIKLDGGNNSKNIDISQLLNDNTFMSQMKDFIMQSVNTEINGGRFLSDNSTRRGGWNTTIWGH